MSDDEPTIIACPACGTVHEDASDLLASIRNDLVLAERALRTERAKSARLQADAFAKLTASPHYEAACRVLGFWRNILMPNAKEITSEKRLRPVIARLGGGYSESVLNLAAMGYAKFPYVLDGRRSATGPADRKYVDADLIFRDAKHVDQGLRLWQRHLDDEKRAA